MDEEADVRAEAFDALDEFWFAQAVQDVEQLIVDHDILAHDLTTL